MRRRLPIHFDTRYLPLYAIQAVLAVAIVWIGIQAYERFVVAQVTEERKDGTVHNLASLKDQQESLQKQVEYLQSERGIEAELRRQFDVTLPGEQVVVIVTEEGADGVENSSSETDEEEGEEVKRWWQIW